MRHDTSIKVQQQKMHNLKRQGEAGTVPVRQQRFYAVGTDWYFHTREGLEQGPYKDLHAAKDGLKLFLRRCGIVRFVS